MADIETLKALRERVRSATGPDREIDCYVEAFVARSTDNGQFNIVGPPTYDPRRFFYNPLPEVDWVGYDLLNVAPAYTASLDAALALVERMLPGWTVARIGQDDSKRWSAELRQGHLTSYDRAHYFVAATPALALLAALLSAMIADAEAALSPPV